MRFASSQLLEDKLDNATVVEYDPRGVKVLRLANQNYLKIFRLRRAWSFARWLPYSKRFCKNANRLANLNIPTVTIKCCYTIREENLFAKFALNIPTKKNKNLFSTAVEYQPLIGETLKQMLQSNQLRPTHIEQLGMFIAKLHKLGIHFRSLHLGNIVLAPDGQMGLIDIADMRIYPWSLWFNTKLRSLRHLTRYAKLNAEFGNHNWGKFIESYIKHGKLTGRQTKVLEKRMKLFLSNPPH
jgi:tRNA A-37 threonylcarbamoyl transferase component Bud32